MYKSWTTKCGNSNGCITVTEVAGEDAVRLDTELDVIEISMTDWLQLAAAVKAGDLDHIGALRDDV